MKRQDKLINEFLYNVKDRDQGNLFEYEKDNILEKLMIILTSGFNIYYCEDLGNYKAVRGQLTVTDKNVKYLLDKILEIIEILK